MSIISKFILTTIILIIFVISANIYFFQYFLSKHFDDYTREVISEVKIVKDIDIDDIIDSFSPEIIEKYQELDKSLGLFTDYLENDVSEFVDSETSIQNLENTKNINTNTSKSTDINNFIENTI